MIRRPLDPRVASIEQLVSLTGLAADLLERLVLEAPSLYSRFEVLKPNGDKRVI